MFYLKKHVYNIKEIYKQIRFIRIYFTVSKYLQLNDPTNTNIIKFQTEGHKLLKKTKDKDADHEIDEDKQETYQDYNYFLRSYSYFSSLFYFIYS